MAASAKAYRLSGDVVPRAYRVDLSVDPRKADYAGTVEIDVDVARPVKEIALHSLDLEIGAAVVEAGGRTQAAGAAVKRTSETCHLRVRAALPAGPATVTIPFRGRLRDDLVGLYGASQGRRKYAVTQLESVHARKFFPCFDEPTFKATFELTVHTPKGNVAISNAPVAATETSSRTVTYRFARTAVLSTYLVALCVGDFAASAPRHVGKTPIRVWHVPGKEQMTGFALEAAAECLARLEKWFGLRYPYEKLDLIAPPDFHAGAMENAGAVTFREGLLLADPKTVTLPEQKRIAEVIAHEIAHMWFGDLVTMSWWDDLWLNEAFASWMAYRIVDDWKPEWELWLDFGTSRAGAFSLDGLRSTHPIYAPAPTPESAEENFDDITYWKGASVVRMLEQWLGANAFRDGVRRYIRRHREGNTLASDLWAALDEASGRDVTSVANAWINTPGFPLVRVAHRDGADTATVRQERYFSDERVPAVDRAARWPIPLTVAATPARGARRTARELSRTASKKVDLARSAAWVYGNAAEAGFYRPLHEPLLLDRIVDDASRLLPSERTAIVGHEWAGVRGAYTDLTPFLNLLDRLADDTHHAVLEALAGPLGFLVEQTAADLGADAQDRLRAWIANRFRKQVREVGWKGTRREDDNGRLRRVAVLALGGELGGDPEVLAAARTHLNAYLTDRGAVDPNLAPLVVRLAARTGDDALWERYRRQGVRAKVPQDRLRFQRGLADFRRADLVGRAVEYALGDDIPTQDAVHLFIRTLDNPEGRETTWEFMKKRWTDVTARTPGFLGSYLVEGLGVLRTPAMRTDIAKWLRAHPVPAARRTTQQMLERMDLNTLFRARTAEPLAAWLDAHT